MSREEEIARTFVELADTFVDDFDVIDFLHQLTVRCKEILTVADAAVLLAWPGSRLHSPAPCDPSPALATLLETAVRQGPALEAYRSASAVTHGNLAHAPDGWRDFTTHARQGGYTTAHALPLRLRRETLGSLLLLGTTAEPLPLADLALAQAFADAATIGLLHSRTLQNTQTVNQQLHTALQSRIVIEQAKGILAARLQISLAHAFDTMRRHARHHRLLLTTVARSIIDTGQLPDPPSPPQEGTSSALRDEGTLTE
ncbi:ANTAR domain-containing protein [Streptomyces purpurogeneiscleroticus]|uniref:ANTAR domain-containing protein n=1 Tax=Streptomyces purpurogeneiscleroticus TaxID=68259 RepID=UPI001CBF7D26|nr:ANTAR domain-containing protein [Streptomyces purpurogeneiscleroticus]